MSIASEITRLQGVKADILQSIADKGVTVPAGSALDDCPGLIANIGGGYGFETVFLTYFANVANNIDTPEIGDPYSITNRVTINKIYLNGSLRNAQKENSSNTTINLSNYVNGKKKANLKIYFVMSDGSYSTARIGMNRQIYCPDVVVGEYYGNLVMMFSGGGGSNPPSGNVNLGRFSSYSSNLSSATDITYSYLNSLCNCIEYKINFEDKKVTIFFNSYPLISCDYNSNGLSAFVDSQNADTWFTGVTLDVA